MEIVTVNADLALVFFGKPPRVRELLGKFEREAHSGGGGCIPRSIRSFACRCTR